MYSPFGTSAAADFLAFFNTFKSGMPGSLTWTIDGAGDVINDATGDLTGAWTDAGAGSVTSTGSGAYAAGTGLFVNWATGTIVNGRRLNGRTFVCPILGSGYDSTGTLGAATLAVFQTAATNLAATGSLVIWHRPTTPGGSDGSSSVVISGIARDQATSLKSRRT
jgi:hypothetical protein